MRNRSGRDQAIRAFAFVAALVIPFEVSFAAESVISGRLTDRRGAAISGATVLVFPAASPDGPAACAAPPRPVVETSEGGSRQAAGAPGCVLLRTDLDGGFVALLPPGRYMVAAVKPGYDVALTEVHSLASRVLRMRLTPTPAETLRRKPAPGRGLEWLLRAEKDDILRSAGAALPPPFEVIAAAGSGGTAAPGDIFGPLDGDVTQSLTAADLPGVSSASIGDAGRATTLAVRAPVDDRLAWSFAAGSARTQAEIADTGEVIAGGADRILAGAEYGGASRTPLRGAVRVGVGRVAGGSAEVGDRLLAASGTCAAPGGGDPIEVAVQAWSAEARFDDGGFIALGGGTEGDAAAPVSGHGMSVYAGSRHAFGAATTLRYGLEYRGDSLGGGARALPRVGVSRALRDGAGLELNADLLLDPGRMGGRVGIEGRPGGTLRIAAAVAVVPEFADLTPAGAGAAGPAGAQTPAALAGGRRTVDLSVARDFGPLRGSVTGSVGRITRRSLPVIDDGPVPIVSRGAERYYETRLGVAWRPSTTEMQVGYRRVEAGAEGGAAGHDYRRLDLMVSQGLPSPRALDGARLRALVAWQAVAYDAALGGAGAPVSGIASRLSGGVGLSF